MIATPLFLPDVGVCKIGQFYNVSNSKMDKDGCVFLTGRTREMAKRGGEQISLNTSWCKRPGFSTYLRYFYPDGNFDPLCENKDCVVNLM